MKCPKCQYISFDSMDRCRNCGYELSLSQEAAPLDLAIQRDDEPLGPMRDLPLGERPVAGRTPEEPLSHTPAHVPKPRASASGLDLPLFAGGNGADDRPLVTPTAVPRPPLAVRRATPGITAPPRSRPAPAPEDEDPVLDLEDSSSPFVDEPVVWEDSELRERAMPAADPGLPSAVARLAAGLIDVLILGLIDASVVYLTLGVLGLDPGDVLSLPLVPLIAFLLLLNGGYLVIFTAAGGQTIGKMTTGLRVVAQDEHGMTGRVGFGSAVVRAASYLASALPAGLGFAPILFSDDGRALHDRLSDTRVVRA